jgi:long-chain fatty acid transport protein
MTTPFRRTRIATALAGFALALGAGHAAGAGFALQENSGSGLGNAFAGGAAVAEDASTIWANPAGMSRIGTMQAAGALHLIQPSMKFNNGASVAAAQQTLGGDGGDAGTFAAVPNMYGVFPINKEWAFGLGVNAPFGLVTEYDNTWIGRFQAVKSDIKTLNINPALSWKPVENLAIGAGADYQQIKATFTNQVNYSAALLGAAQVAGIAPGSATFNAIAQSTPGLESAAKVKGDDWAWGWNVGVLWDIDRNNRIGAHYRSSLTYHITGNATFTNPALPAVPSPIAPVVGLLAAGVNNTLLYNSGVTSTVKLPEIVNISYFGKVSDRWDIMADAQFTGWDKVKELKFTRTDGKPLTTEELHWEDVWRFAIGANYHPDAQWTFRGGVTYDESPMSDAFRTARLPDGDRIWVTAGVQYKVDRQWTFDVGAAYGWAKDDPAINRNGGSTATYGLINGTYDVSFVIVSGQITYSF